MAVEGEIVAEPFYPVQPRRVPDYVSTWRGFFGERLRNTIYGWPEPAFGEAYRLRNVMGYRVHLLLDPDLVEHVLLTNKTNYIRPRLAQRLLSPVIGNGLLTAEGDLWRKQRKIVAPTFSPGAVAAMGSTIVNVARERIAAWPDATRRIDMAAEATHTTMEIIANSLFAGDKRLVTDEATRHIEAMLAAGGQARLSLMLGLQDWDMSKPMREGRKGQHYLRETLGKLVDERGPGGGTDDFFGGLIRTLYSEFQDDEARELAVDNAITFYLAGHETTANTLAWSIYLLAAQPTLQSQVREEARAALACGEAATLVERLPLLRRVVEESLRLYPPAPRLDREALADETIENDRAGPIRVKKGDLLSIWPWVLHRHRNWWDDPDRFDPDRFLPDRRTAYHRHQYIPFGAGPRICVGARFAMTEALIILAYWVAARRFSLPAGFQPDPAASITLRPRTGMPLMAEPV